MPFLTISVVQQCCHLTLNQARDHQCISGRCLGHQHTHIDIVSQLEEEGYPSGKLYLVALQYFFGSFHLFCL